MAGPDQLVLGLEGGGTKTEWILVRRGDGGIVAGGRLAPANLRLISDAELGELLAGLPREVASVGLFLAGCGDAGDRARLGALARAHWPDARLVVGSDRDSGLAACFGDGDGVLVIAGTGSAVTARKAGRVEKAGGRGHLLGDKGGAYDLALEGVSAALRRYDLERAVTPLAARVLRSLALNGLDELAAWAQAADALALARLAPLVFAAAADGDDTAVAVIEAGARALAEYAAAVARRAGLEAPLVKLAGGVFLNQVRYVERFAAALAVLDGEAQASVCATSGALGAVRLAAGAPIEIRGGAALDAPPSVQELEELATALTEQVNPRAHGLEALGSRELVALFASEERHVAEALAACVEPLARALDLVAARLQGGGRLYYVGAGTSGRLGVLDASEVPPTFGVPPELVQGIIAGGAGALSASVEGAEDRPQDGAAALVARGVLARDVVCGISASGRTPFVAGALARARALGAGTILLSCNPARRRASPPWDVEVDLATGPELVAGSTRLKAGSATKAALNILSTGAMIRLGRVRDGAMIDVRASNAKLRDRAARLVRSALSCSYEDAVARLEACGWDVRRALSGQ